MMSVGSHMEVAKAPSCNNQPRSLDTSLYLLPKALYLRRKLEGFESQQPLGENKLRDVSG